jgi:hypothetical protein
MPVIANLLPLLPGSRTAVAFRFTPYGDGGDWTIDDVYVDPGATGEPRRRRVRASPRA